MLSDTEAGELNRAAARAMGWFEWEEDDKPAGVWEMPNGDPITGLPDFCGDTHAFGYLLDYLQGRAEADPAFAWGIGHDDFAWSIGHDGDDASDCCGWCGDVKSTFYCHGDFPGECVVRAILAEAKKEAGYGKS